MKTDELKEFVTWLSGWQVEGEHFRQKEQLEQSLPGEDVCQEWLGNCGKARCLEL